MLWRVGIAVFDQTPGLNGDISARVGSFFHLGPHLDEKKTKIIVIDAGKIICILNE